MKDTMRLHMFHKPTSMVEGIKWINSNHLPKFFKQITESDKDVCIILITQDYQEYITMCARISIKPMSSQAYVSGLGI